MQLLIRHMIEYSHYYTHNKDILADFDLAVEMGVSKLPNFNSSPNFLAVL